MKILLTGGTGYIGSHTALELLNTGYEVVIIDNLSNSKKEVVDMIKSITQKDVVFYEGDLRNEELVTEIFEKESIDAVIHFAGLKAVGESVQKPLYYYQNNIDSTLVLLSVMQKMNCKKIVFSSSATVYGDPIFLPLTEDHPLSTTNPYGSTKLFIENILQDLYVSDNEWGIVILRYFNPVGSHESFLIGENPNGIPNNLMPFINKVAFGDLEVLSVFGDDYDTKDGTGVRDYIHITDLAIGHLRALEYIKEKQVVEVVNLGTGNGYSVLELVNSYENVNNIKLNYKIVERRPGDIATCYADATKAKKIMNWQADKSINEMCKSAYEFYKNVKTK